MGWPQWGQVLAAEETDRRHSGQVTSGIDRKKYRRRDRGAIGADAARSGNGGPGAENAAPIPDLD
jgi:hypothetical protein